MSTPVLTIGEKIVPADVLEEAQKRARPFLSGCGLEVAHWAALTAAFSQTILAERESSANAAKRYGSEANMLWNDNVDPVANAIRRDAAYAIEAAIRRKAAARSQEAPLP